MIVRRLVVAALASSLLLACTGQSHPPAPTPSPRLAPDAAVATAPVVEHPKFSDEELARPVRVEGRVVDENGVPEAGLRVAAMAANQLTATAATASGAEGRFSLELPPGTYGLTATGATITAGYLDAVQVAPMAPMTGVDLHVGGPGYRITGHVRDETGKPVAGALAGGARLSDFIGDLFLVEAGADGGYTIQLPPGRYIARAESPAARQFDVAEPFTLDGDRVADVELVSIASLERPAPDSVLAWLRAGAVPLGDELAPLAKLVGKARIVGLGEATSGSHELFQLKQRLIEYLVAKQGFTALAIDAGWPETIALDDYLQDGSGDARAALAGLGMWTWNSEEQLALVEWMRAWNADPAHKRKLHVYGLDMQTSPAAVDGLTAFLERVDPDAAALAHGLLLPLASVDEQQGIQLLDDDTRAGLRKYVADLIKRFDKQQRAWSKQTSAREWRNARQHAVVLGQAIDFYAAARPDDINNARDRALAANLAWIADKAEPGAKVIVWAHNLHVARRGAPGWVNLGEQLAARYKQRYLAIGFVFGEGGFQAIGPAGLDAWTVGASPPGSLGAIFATAGPPVFAIDLRKPPRGEVTAWLRAPHLMRQIGALFTGEADMDVLERLADDYDLTIFVARTTRAHPLEMR